MNLILLLGAYIFTSGLIIALTRRNAILVLIGIELMLNAANLNFIYFSKGVEGQLYVIFIMVLAAAEAAIGLAIIVQMFRRFKTVSLEKIGK